MTHGITNIKGEWFTGFKGSRPTFGSQDRAVGYDDETHAIAQAQLLQMGPRPSDCVAAFQ